MSVNDTSNPPINELSGVHIFLFICAIIISVMAVTCNSLLIGVIVRSKLLKTPTNMFIASLAVGELLMGVFNIPFAAASVIVSGWPFSGPVCQMTASLQTIGRTSSTYSLTAICIDRCLAVSKPLKYSHLLTLKTASVSLALIWLLSCVISFIPLGNWGTYEYASGYYLCILLANYSGKQHVAKEVICSFVPALTMCLTSLHIVRQIKSHHRIFAIVQLPITGTSGTPGDMLPGLLPGPRGFNRNTNKAMRSLFIVIGAYAIFYLPLSVVNVLYQDHDPSLVPKDAVTSVVWISFLCCVINPVIIILFNRKFRAQLKTLVSRRPCKPAGATAAKEVFTISTGLHSILDATLVLSWIKHQDASTTASIRRKVFRLATVR